MLGSKFTVPGVKNALMASVYWQPTRDQTRGSSLPGSRVKTAMAN